MDAEDLAKAAFSAINDWLDEEIVGFEPEEGYQNKQISYLILIWSYLILCEVRSIPLL